VDGNKHAQGADEKINDRQFSILNMTDDPQSVAEENRTDIEQH
jgi:hypothetical protein